VIAVAEENARGSGVAERIRFIQARATDIELPEPVHVVVSDMAGALPLFEEHLPSIMHARDRLLAPGGILIPQRDRLYCALVSSATIRESIVEPWRSVPGVNLARAEMMALHAPHAWRVTPSDLAGEPRVWAELDYAAIRSPNVSGSVEWSFAAPTEIHALALWFESTLHGDIAFGSGPTSHESVHATMLLPLLQPLTADGAFRVQLEATLASGRYVVTWQAGHGPRQSTFQSEPRSAASLTARESVPARDAPRAANVRVSERVLARRVADELLLLDLASGTYHVLNETGARVWDLLAEGQTLETVAMNIARDYDVDPQCAAADVNAVVANLLEAKLIEP
jgi:protein arginine N-methyltransferase 1